MLPNLALYIHHCHVFKQVLSHCCIAHSASISIACAQECALGAGLRHRLLAHRWPPPRLNAVSCLADGSWTCRRTGHDRGLPSRFYNTAGRGVCVCVCVCPGRGRLARAPRASVEAFAALCGITPLSPTCMLLASWRCDAPMLPPSCPDVPMSPPHLAPSVLDDGSLAARRASDVREAAVGR